MLTASDRWSIGVGAIKRLGALRAVEATKPPHPPEAPKWGFDGVDIPRKGGSKFRARIRFSENLSGKDCRITLGSFDSAEAAGYAYAVAHVKLWGSFSRYVSDVSPEYLASLVEAAK